MQYVLRVLYCIWEISASSNTCSYRLEEYEQPLSLPDAVSHHGRCQIESSNSQ